MKVLKIYFLFVIIVTALGCNNSTVVNEPINSFLKDVKNSKVSYKSIIEKHLCTDLGPKKAERRLMLVEQLQYLRLKLNGEPKGIEPTLKRYEDLPTDEQTLLMDDSSIKDVFRYSSKNGGKFFILIRDGKIASFTVMRKGRNGVFIIICG